jgi:hypothetical protein
LNRLRGWPWLVALLLLGAGVAGAEQPRTVLVMPLELVDTSLEGEIYGESEEQTARLAATTRYMERRLAGAPGYEVRERRRVAELLARFRGQYAYVYRCHGCLMEAGRAADAELVLSGWVQKVSNLILEMSIRVHRVADGDLIAADFVSLRGNTDLMWQRSAARLLEDTMLPAPVTDAR